MYFENLTLLYFFSLKIGGKLYLTLSVFISSEPVPRTNKLNKGVSQQITDQLSVSKYDYNRSSTISIGG